MEILTTWILMVDLKSNQMTIGYTLLSFIFPPFHTNCGVY